MQKFHLAQINIAKIKGVDMDDPIMKEFVENTDRVNALADESPGFVWRLPLTEDDEPMGENTYFDEKIIINMSIWTDVKSLENYVYRTFHSDFIRKRKDWFHKYGKVHAAMWWIPVGIIPSVQDGVDKLDVLHEKGPSDSVFDFKNPKDAPNFS